MNMDFKDLRELEFNNIGAWPVSMIIVLIIILSVLMLFGGYWFDTKNQLNYLDFSQQEENNLKNRFEEKASKAANLAAYKAQIKAIKKNFSVMLRQLPETTEVPGLVEDISQQGLAAGLQFRSIRLQPERAVDFYVELPIEIAVVGTYHQLAEFVSHVSALPRIVTIHDFVIHAEDQKKEKGLDRLLMSMTAKTYRYTDKNEKNAS